MYWRWKSKVFIALLFLGYHSTVSADLPLTIEDLITQQNRYRVDFSMAYANSDRQRVSSRYQIFEAGNGQFIQLPVSVGDNRRNADILAMTFGFRYGLTTDTELLARVNGVIETTRYDNKETNGVETSASDSSQQLKDLILGVNHRISDDTKTPALLAFLELGLAENTAIDDSDFVYGKNLQLGLTTYRAIDPLVLSLTAGYRYTDERDVKADVVDPGDFFYVNPSIAFAVNSEVTLTTGLQLSWRGNDNVNDVEAGIDTSKTKLELGLGYGWSKRLTLNLNSRADISGNSGSEVNLTASYKFWQPKGALEKTEEKLKRKKEKEGGKQVEKAEEDQEPTPAQAPSKTDENPVAGRTSTEPAPSAANASTRSPATQTEKPNVIESATPQKQTESDDASLANTADQTPAIADTLTQEAKIVNCSASGVDLKRRLETSYDNYPAELPCKVVYYKEDGATQLIAKSQYTPGYCANKRDEFLEKLNRWGWQCKE